MTSITIPRFLYITIGVAVVVCASFFLLDTAVYSLLEHTPAWQHLVTRLVLEDVSIHNSIDAFAKLQMIILRFTILYSIITLFICIRYEYVQQKITSFFTASDHPLNLAIARIVVFGVLLHMIRLDWILPFSELPEHLRIAPPGTSWFVDILPITPDILATLYPLFVATSVLSIIGFYTRISASICVLLAIYYLGIPQLFGKINHYHHVVWLATILSVSPCADMLSLDACIARFGHRYVTLQRSILYGLPLRIMWLLVALTYFFPGLWKFLYSGFGWVLSDNVLWTMYHKWFELGGWTPMFRIDHYPLLYKSAGFATLVFELFFIVILFYPVLRRCLPIAGMLFHESIRWFMNISFTTLQWMYVVFINWAYILEKISFLKPLPESNVVQKPSKIKLIACVGSILITLNAVQGFLLIDSWPTGVYPRFMQIRTEEKNVLEITLRSKDESVLHREIAPYNAALSQALGAERLSGLTRTILRAESKRQQELTLELFEVWKQYLPLSSDVFFIDVSHAVVSVDPKKRSQEPLRFTFLHRIRPTQKV